MKPFWRVIAAAGSVTVILGAAIAWHTYKPSAESRRLAEIARVTRARAEHGNVNAAYALGTLYLQGRGVRQDYAEAIRWYRSGADRGDAASEYGLGYMFDTGKGVPRDFAQALGWYQKAAKQNNRDAQCGIAGMYY
jgi:hypothetical protein